jgi:hypothetical protein
MPILAVSVTATTVTTADTFAVSSVTIGVNIVYYYN